MLNVNYGHCIMLNINYCHWIRIANLLLGLILMLISVITSQINICYCKWFELLVIKLPIGEMICEFKWHQQTNQQTSRSVIAD
jgi:hypothetical protein